MAEIAQAYLALIPSLQGAGRTIAKELDGPDVRRAARSAGDSMGKTMGGRMGAGVKALVAPALAGLATVGVTSFFKDAVGSASDLNETINAANVIFGKNADEVQKWSKGSARNFGLSREAALEAATGFGNMLQQLGYTGEEALSASTGVVGLAADLGSFRNLPTGDVLDRISAAMRGEYDSLQLLVPNINAARVEQEALAMTGKTSTDALTAQEKAAATLAIVQRDGAAAAGDFAETSDGLANKGKIAAAQFEDLKSKIGTAFLPAVQNAMGWISDTGIPALAGFGDVVTDRVWPAVQEGWGKVTATLGTLDIDWDAVRQSVIDGVGGVAQPVIDALGTGMRTGNYGPLGSALGEAVRTALGKIGDLAGDLFAAMSDLIGKVDWPGLSMELGRQVPALLLGLVTGLLNFDWNPIFTFIGDHWTELLVGVLAIAFAPSRLIGPIGTALSKIPFVGPFLETALLWLNGIGGQIGQRFLKPLWGRFVSGFTAGIPVLQRGFKGLLDNMVVPIFVWADDLVLWFRAIPGRIFNALGDLAEYIGLRFRQMADYARVIVSDMWSKVSGVFKSGVSNIGSWLAQGMDNAGRIFDRLRAAAAKPINFVLGTVYNDGIRKWWNNIAGAVGLDSLRLPAASLVAFANGTEDHRAQIAPAGAMRLWAEPETGGEAYIPLAASKRSRSTQILADVARRFGYGLTAYADGGFWGNLGTLAGDVWERVKGAAGNVADFLKDPAGTVTRGLGRVVDNLIGGVGGGDLGRMVAALPGKLVGGIANAVKSLTVAGPEGGAANAMGYRAQIAALHGRFPGARVTSSFRPGAITATGYRSYHGLGRAIDIAPNMAVFNWLASTFPNSRELYGPTSTANWIRNGRRGGNFAARTIADHKDHIHWVMANGGMLFDRGGWMPSGGVGVNLSGRPEAVLTPEESRALKSGTLGGSITIQNVRGATVDEVAEQILWAKRRLERPGKYNRQGVLA